MTAAYQIPPNPNGVDLFTVGPSRAGRLVNPSVSVGFTYGYSRCPASRDLSGDSRMIVSSYYLSAYGPLAWAPLVRPLGAQSTALRTESTPLWAESSPLWGGMNGALGLRILSDFRGASKHLDG